MEKRWFTVGGVSSWPAEPVFVIATQNPSNEEEGFPLRESQCDRLLMRVELSYSGPMEKNTA
jgi:MoxR-like ATPase